MESLKSLTAKMAATKRRVAAFKRTRARHLGLVAVINEEIARLTTGDTPPRPAKRQRGARGLAAWILTQRLPATIAALAGKSRRAGFSGRPNAVAAAAKHSRKLQRLKDGRIGYA